MFFIPTSSLYLSNQFSIYATYVYEFCIIIYLRILTFDPRCFKSFDEISRRI